MSTGSIIGKYALFFFGALLLNLFFFGGVITFTIAACIVFPPFMLVEITKEKKKENSTIY